MKSYTPHPIDLSAVKLHDDLTALREAIAENAHEVWAAKRQSEGWTYGPVRSDALKQTPDMVPYNELTDSEKEYDREMAMQTIKLMHSLGYDLVKRQDTPLYRDLLQKIRLAKPIFRHSCGCEIFRYQVFCPNCGRKLDYLDFKE